MILWRGTFDLRVEEREDVNQELRQSRGGICDRSESTQGTEDMREKVDVLLSRDTSVSQCPVFSRPLWPLSCVWEVIG